MLRELSPRQIISEINFQEAFKNFFLHSKLTDTDIVIASYYFSFVDVKVKYYFIAFHFHENGVQIFVMSFFRSQQLELKQMRNENEKRKPVLLACSLVSFLQQTQEIYKGRKVSSTTHKKACMIIMRKSRKFKYFFCLSSSFKSSSMFEH